MASREAVLTAAKQFLNFVNKTPSPFHAVDELKKMLDTAGFQELRESEHWDIKPLNKYFVTRNQSTIIAFAVGGQFKPGNGFSIVGAHTDSPCLKVKPISKKSKSGYLMVGVQCYGGGLWHTWLDRDLTLGGQVLVKNGDKIEHRLAHIRKPILRIPNLAIHLQRDTFDGFSKESHLCPMIASIVQDELQGRPKSDATDDQTSSKPSESKSSLAPQYQNQAEKHQPVLVKLLCEELKVEPEQLLDFELCLADTQPAAIGGAYDEFLFSPRLDNLLNAYCACQAIIDSCQGKSLNAESNIRLICLFDNEEVGSTSAQGADSTLQELILRRLSSGGSQTAFEEAIPKSYMISADQAHAVHPNYSEKHESNHQPAFHKGIAVKFNANQRYATTAITTSILREIARIGDVPLQDFVVKNDSPCGSTIGPIMSSKLGMQTIDVGGPMLSMHSIREMGDTSSVQQTIALFKAFFENYPQVYARLNV